MDISFYKEQLQAKEDMLARTTKFLVEVQKSLEKKNIELSVINKNILDSINVAERIQKSLLPDIEILKLFFKDATYKVIQQIGVGGDSIFIKKFNGNIIFGLLDSTGHGIPAAMLSISCTLLLRELTASSTLDNPKELLELLDHQLYNIFNNHTFAIAQAEGLICSFSPLSNKLIYSSAKGKALLAYKTGKIEELAYTRKAIGSKREMPFENFEIDLENIDKLLVYSDGLIDQFGGEDGRRFSRVRLMDVFQRNINKEVSEITAVIENELNKWKNTYKQTDDISFLIIKF